MTYRSRGRSIFEVIVVSVMVMMTVLLRRPAVAIMLVQFSLTNGPFWSILGTKFRRFALLGFWWGLSLSCALEITSVPSGHKSDRDKDGSPSKMQITIIITWEVVDQRHSLRVHTLDRLRVIQRWQVTKRHICQVVEVAVLPHNYNSVGRHTVERWETCWHAVHDSINCWTNVKSWCGANGVVLSNNIVHDRM